MKLEEMSDVLDGLATTLEKFLGKTSVNDIHTLAACLRKFSGESVGAFCTFVVQAREGKPSGRPSASTNTAKVDEFVTKIQHFLDQRQQSDYSSIRQMVVSLDKMKVPEIKAVGERVGCPLRERTKKAMLSSLENWLSNIKLSADQSSFSLATARS
jgi:hypothetical protein